MIYIISHKSPDLDSTISALAYTDLKNKLSSSQEYRAAVAGKINKETVYILKKFNLPDPENLENIAGKNIILIDHNEFSQAQDGVSEAKIIEILDHHKVKFEYSEPITLEVRPWGSSCSIVADKYFSNNISIPSELSGALLAGILVDTVITKSPTCTEHDKNIIDKLSMLSGISDWKEFGMEIFKVRSDITEYSDEAIIHSDFKDFEVGTKKFGIGQVETANLSAFESRENALLTKMEDIRTQDGYHSVILFITDIINEGSKFLVSSEDKNILEKAFNAQFKNNKAYIKGIMSRKKQVVPMLMEVLK